MNTIAGLGLAINSESAVQAADDLDRLVDSGKGAEDSAKRVESAWAKAVTGISQDTSQVVKELQLMNSRQEATAQLMVQLSQAVGKASGSFVDASANAQKLAAAGTKVGETAEQAKARIMALAVAATQASDHQTSLNRAYDATAGASAAAQREQLNLLATQTRAAASARDNAVAQDKSADSTKRASGATAEEAIALGKLLGQIDPTVTALKKLDAAQDELAKFNAAGILPDGEFAKYTSKIDQARAGLTRFDEGISRTGNTAKQNAAALRMLPAQFSDIVISLQGGQAPLTVFMQQGAQIKDSFGGAGAAVKAMGGYVAGLVSPLTVGAAAAGILGAVFYDAEKQVSAFNKSLFSGTASSGQTASSLAEIAATVSGITGDISEANAAVVALAGSAKLSQTQFINLAQASASIAEFTGTSAAEVAKALGDIGGNATKAAEKISSQYGLLTSAQYGVIAALDEQGKKQEALDALSGYLNENAQKRLMVYKGSLSDLERGWNDIGTAISNAYSKVKAELFPDLSKEAELIERVLKTREEGGVTGAISTGLGAISTAFDSALGLVDRDSTEALQKRLAQIKERIALGRQAAVVESEAGKAEQARIEATGKWNSEQKAGLTGLAKLEEDISQKRALGLAAGRSQVEIEKEVTALRDKYEKSLPKGKAGSVDLTSYNDSQNALKALVAGYDNSFKELDALQKAGLITQEQYSAQSAVLIRAEKDEVAAAYEAEIASLEAAQGKKSTTAEQSIQLDQKIADARASKAKALQDLDSKLNVLAVNEEGRLKKQTAAVENYIQALDDQLAQTRQQLQLQAAGVGMGDEARKRLQEDIKIQQDYQDKLDKLLAQRNKNAISQDVYDQETDAVRKALAERLQLQKDYYAAVEAEQSNWLNGATSAIQTYLEEARNVAGQTKSAFLNAFDGLEDVLVSFVTGGKASFKDFANSVLADIARIVLKTQVLAPILNSLFGAGTVSSGSGGGVVSSLLGASGGSSSGGSMFSGLAGIGKTLYSIYDAITGVGSSIYSGYASGGFAGAVQGGVGYYGVILNGIGGTLSSGFTSLIGGQALITGATAAGTAATTAALTGVTAEVALSTAATVGAEGITAASLSAAVAEGAASIGTNIGVAGATTAAASGGIGAAISSALSSAAAMWPLAVIMGMYQSGKLYEAGVRPDAGEMWESGGSTALGKASMIPATLQSKAFEITDGINSKLVGGKLAAIISGSTLHQAVWGAVGKKLFGSGYEVKDSGIALGVDDGEFDARSWIQQKKKKGLISGSSKTKDNFGELDAATKDPLGAQYNEVVLTAGALFKSLGVKLGEDALDGINVAWRNISTTDGSTPEWIQEQLNYFFAQVGDSAVQSISAATDAGLSGFSYASLQTFVKNLQDVNGVLDHLNVGLYEGSVQGGFMAEQLAAWAGGIEALSAVGAKYYDRFFTDVEKSSDTLSDVRSAFTALGVAMPDSAQGFRDMVGGIDKTTEAGRQMLLKLLGLAEAAGVGYDILESRQSTYYSAFYSEAENTARSLADITQEFKDVSVTLPETRAGYRDLVEAASKDSSAAGKKMYDTLMSLNAEAASAYDILETKASSAADATKALAETLAGNVSNAMSAVQRAVSADQKALTAAYNARTASLNDMLQTAQSKVTDLTSVSGSLESALKSLNGTSDDAVKMLRNQAQATLQSALATARAGGSLSGMTGLEDALDVVSSNSTDLYSSMEDFARDQGRTANVVAELSAVTGVQLTTEQKLLKTVEDQIEEVRSQYDAQMEGLTAQLDLAQAQVDKLNGIDNSVMSVKDAIAALGIAISAASAAKAAATVATGTFTGTAGAPSASDLNAVYNSVLGRDVDPSGAAYWAGLLGSGGVTPAGLAAAIKADAAKNGELPAYATGGLLSGPGTGTSDSMLIRASTGEYVISADGVKAYGTDVLDQINSSSLKVADSGPSLNVTGPLRSLSGGQGSTARGGDPSAAVTEISELRREIEGNATYEAQLLKIMADGIETLVNSGMQIIGTVETKVATQ